MGDKKKLLFVGSFLSWKYGTIGPIERLADQLSTDYHVKACSFITNKFLRFFDIFFNALFGNYAILHVDVFSGRALIYALTGTLIARLRRKKSIIVNLHGGKLPFVYPEKKRVIKRILQFSTLIITPSRFLHTFFAEKGYNVKYLPNFIDQERFPYNPFNKENCCSVLWLRAFSGEYNPQTAIRAIKIIKNRYPDVLLTMIGPDKGELKACKELINDLNLTDHIRILGPVSNQSLTGYFHSHYLFINTPSYESFGLGVLEAASSGVPVLSFNVGEIPLLWESEKEILLCSKEPEAMAGRMIEAFENPGKMAEMARHAKEKANNFTWEQVSKYWKEILEYGIS
ncbi:MAG: glycosyltransferase family 4 protein [Bacteroidota bacterium]